MKDLVELINAGYPMIGELIHKKKVLVSVNQEIAHEETDIRDDDEVALLPPFAGGAPPDVETGCQLRSHVAQRFNVHRWDGDSHQAEGWQSPSLAVALLTASLNILLNEGSFVKENECE